MNNILKVLLVLIVVGCFNLIFYACNGVDNANSVWITYGFMNLALLYPCFIGFIIYQKSEVKFSGMLIAAIYCIAELIVGTVFLLLSLDTCLWAFVIQFILFSVAAIGNILYVIMDHSK